jgi:hypothetical protein
VRFIDRHLEQFSFEHMVSGKYRLADITDAIRAMAEFREVKPAILATA